jgi:hypothetical protein
MTFVNLVVGPKETDEMGVEGNGAVVTNMPVAWAASWPGWAALETKK